MEEIEEMNMERLTDINKLEKFIRLQLFEDIKNIEFNMGVIENQIEFRNERIKEYENILSGLKNQINEVKQNKK